MRQRPRRVRPELVSIPQQLYERLRDVVLAADVMFVNGLPFFVTLSRGIKLLTTEFLPSCTANQLHDSLQTVARLYRRGGFLVKMCLMDMEFKPLEDVSKDVPINTTATREHVTDVERSIRVIKDRCRSVISEVPYKHCMPDVFIVFLLRFVVMWLNAFPSGSGVSTEFSPREIVSGLRMDYRKHCRVRWGAYVEASQDPDITNTMNDRTVPCIALGPTGNIQGSVSCYNLQTKQVVTRRTIQPLPMPDRVIRRVVKLGKTCKQNRVSQRIQFLNQFKQQFSWGDGTEDDDSQSLLEPGSHETDILPAEIPGVDLAEDYLGAVQPDAGPTQLQLAYAALANANLRTSVPDSEIAGVDSADPHPPMVSDDEDKADEDDATSSNNSHTRSDVVSLDPHGLDEAEAGQTNMLQDEDEGNTDDVSGIEGADKESICSDEESVCSDLDSNSNPDTSPIRTVRRSTRARKKKEPITIDFANRAYQMKDGTLHISQTMLDQVRQDTKITSPILPQPVLQEPSDGSKMALRLPRTAGVSKQALNHVSVHALGLSSPGMDRVDAIVEDHVVMHILGVVLAEQYSINKGIRLFGDRAKESVSKELKQLHDYVTYTPVHAHKLTPEQKKQALASLIFLTEK